MNIIVVGLGKFGKELTSNLVKEGHNVTIMDNKENVVDECLNQYDVIGFCGNGASYQSLKEAIDNKHIDLLIATTSTDEINMLCCLAAKKLGIRQTIARVRNPEYANQVQLMHNELGISMIVNPDLDTAREIFRSIRFPSALKVESFSNGKVDLVEIKITKDSTLNEKSLIEIHNKYDVKFLVCAVNRNNNVFIPRGAFILKEGDIVYLTSDSKELPNTFKKLKLLKSKLSRVMIIGGGRTCYYLAKRLLESGVSTKIIDKDIESCNTLSLLLPKALVINGNGINQNLLEEEGIKDSDCVVTLTGIDETNILVSSLANLYGVDKIITKVSNNSYDKIISNIGLDIVISPKELFTSNIIRYVRGMNNSLGNEFKTLYRIAENKVEALEFFVSEGNKFINIPIKDLKIKKCYLIASIIREGKVIIPNGNDVILPFDNVIIVKNNNGIISDISDIWE